ncbi:branched-chain amino acid ABC transporter permease [Glaciimonas sp. CA11.2]|uniref:branched-chain amino acid ABC transporter permease n=1 Tax=unclassified Glaciimonas TaxID=2644401 RepID=UPI002AB43C60|nr:MULTISPECIES: branched-chain amino acid ABC transporter permease [unclassified Glaciimonas]MDY7548926.1 branched-chain amino acid ABC transporter permease [Glaciimonas sp. CA11.2]MEB0013624.1 branched-chain amino acid ABC transporter permease [Glaciimonas sp. Cout2]MEB0083650.1 branched-chain amino acid ABC transporter permease [Glaciimonas sp. Gout2]MEB0162977.1 branched-chain amino acid ABC transporter permease [Glaciimonas sp. CA11.2]
MFAQQLANGLVLGAVYALFSLGFTIIFGVLHVINLTYGVYFAVGAYVSLWAAKALGVNLFGALLISAVTTGVFAILLDSIIVTPLRRRTDRYLASLLATTGLSLFAYSLLTRLVGAEPLRFPPNFGGNTIVNLGAITLSQLQISIVGIVLVIVIALFWFLKKSRWGIAARAVGDLEIAALLVGLSPFRITALISCMAGVLAAVAGTLIGMNTNAVEPFMGEGMMLHGFAVVIIGGLGSIPGALVAGLLLGVVEIMTSAYISSAYRDAVTFSLLLATLWFLPTGLIPLKSAKRV